MDYLTQIKALLEAVVILLQVTIGTPNQQQAMNQANQAVSAAQQALVQFALAPSTEPQVISVPIVVSTTIPEIRQSVQISIAPPIPNPTPDPITPPANQPPPKMSTIEFINTNAANGLGRLDKYIASDQETDNSVVEIGALLRDANGNVVRDAVMNVTATDESQNKSMNGTGYQKHLYINGVRTTVFAYRYPYHFFTAGDHTVTFTSGDTSNSISFHAE